MSGIICLENITELFQCSNLSQARSPDLFIFSEGKTKKEFSISQKS